MATAAHTPKKVPADGIGLGASSDFEAITSGAGSGRTFSRSLVKYFIVENTTGSPINLTILGGSLGEASEAGTTIADNTIAIAANDFHLLETHKFLADPSGVVTLEAASAGLQVLAFYGNA